MKTPMNVFNTAMKKKKKNRKGFSLVELIVVLVIMAILAAALVPTLIGYIRQTRQSNAKNEAASAVSAAQTIASSAFASPDYTYVNNSTGKSVDGVSLANVKLTVPASGTELTVDSSSALIADVVYLSELTDRQNSTAGTGVTTIKYNTDYIVTDLAYNDGTTYVYYYKPASGAAKYGVGSTAAAAQTDAGKTA